MFEAEDRRDAEEKASGEVMTQATRIVSALAFTFDEGIVLGDRYKVRPADASNKMKMDATLKVGESLLEIGRQVYENVDSTLSEDEEVNRAINWYNLGLSTETPEDALVAYWTGLESLAEREQADLSEEKERALDAAKEAALAEIDDDNHSLRGDVGGEIGELKTESISQAVVRMVDEFVEEDLLTLNRVEADNLKQAVEMVYDERCDIVHEGKETDDSHQKAAVAEEILKEFLIAKLPNAYSGFISDETPERYPYSSMGVDVENWVPVVFENDPELELDEWEVKRRAIAMTRDLDAANGFPVRNFAGEANPLIQVEDGVFRLNPEFFDDDVC
ncbi:hypothetical protein [Halovenus sp. HT40]|uniref:hypothetical protein n=1 Tax=Halovenus sp. HT40 TaxID=3126691 RepID=UPI00300EEA98